MSAGPGSAALTSDRVVPYLIDLGLLPCRAVVRGEVAVLDASSRNRSYKVTRKQGPGYFVKQGIDADGASTIRNEAATYRLLRGHSCLRPWIPRLRHYDSESGALVLDLLPGDTLSSVHSRTRGLAPELGGDLGTALGTFHRATRIPAASRHAPELPSLPPWVLSIVHARAPMLRDMSAANLALLHIIQRFSGFEEALDRLHDEWDVQSVIHHDLKSDNIMVSARNGRGHRVRILDWELARFGDPSWDVGSVLGEVLALWLTTARITPETPPERIPDLTRYPLRNVFPFVRAFWRAYRDASGLDVDRAGDVLLRSVRYGAARLIQTCQEQVQFAAKPTGSAICLLQMSLHVLQRPEEASVHLLGLPVARSLR